MKMENSEKRPSAEELLRRIQELEKRHVQIKQQISKLTDPFASKLTETQYLNILMSMGQAVHIFDLKFRIIFWNRIAEEIYGYTPEEAIGRTPTEILTDPKDEVLADYLLERTVNGESWSGEFPVTNNRGETFVVMCTTTPFRDENRRLVGGICVSSDSRSYRVKNPHLRVGPPMRIDSQQPRATSIVSKISNLVTKMLKMKIDHGRELDSLNAKLGFFGWQRLSVNQEHELGPRPSFVKLDSQKDLGLWLSTQWINSTSSSSSSQSNAIIKVEKETDNLDSEIMWEDLIIKQQIGQGSCGTVYHGLWYGSDVAVKLFTCHEYTYDMLVSFKQEVSLMKRLRHPNILLFMGAVTSPQRLCIVTEFLPRGSLFQILQRNSTRLDWKRRMHMAMDIARGMNYLHLYNPPIVHRDLKSSNLLVDKNWTAKVGDFGLSRIKHQTYLITKAGKGTPQWMAPEVIRNEQADEKSDVYSYGVILWEIITEKIPWDDLNSMQVIAAVGFMNRRLEIPKDVDPLWSSLIESCWSSEPRSRPTFQEILHMLKDLQRKYATKRKR